MTRVKRAVLVSTFPLVAGLTALAMFLAQGGFGGGHGRFDRSIFLLGLPASAGTTLASSSSDLLTFIVVPALVNTVVWFTAAWAFLKPRRHRAP